MSHEASLPVVSILLTVRNGMAYLPECIDSIVGQTVSDWELIVNDNGSTDGTIAYMEGRAAMDQRIRLLPPSGEDLGAAGGLHRTIFEARAPWLAMVDSDDRMLPQRIERQLAFVAANPDVVATSSLAYYINEGGRRVARTYHDLTSRAAYERYMARDQIIGLLHPGGFVKRETMLAIGGYRREYEPAEDIDMWNRLSERGVVLVQPEMLMEYRVHAAQASARKFDLAHRKHLWVGASMVARRRGEPEPSWEAFCAAWREQPLPVRFNLGREAIGRRLYREAANSKISGRPVAAFVRFAAAVALRPGYAPKRLRAQLLRAQQPAERSAVLQP